MRQRPTAEKAKNLSAPFIKSALPNYDHVPAHRLQRGSVAPVTFLVAVKLGVPEHGPGCRPASFRAIMPVPKAPVDEDRNAEAGQNDIRRTGKVAPMQAVTVPGREEGSTDRPFGAGILPSDGRHHFRTDSRSDGVGHAKTVAELTLYGRRASYHGRIGAVQATPRQERTSGSGKT